MCVSPVRSYVQMSREKDRRVPVVNIAAQADLDYSLVHQQALLQVVIVADVLSNKLQCGRPNN